MAKSKLSALLIILLVFLAYAPAITAGFIWDDDQHLTNNGDVRGDLEGLWRIWTSPVKQHVAQYYPVVFSTLWVEHQIWGLSPMGYHINNILFHCLNAVLIWRILRYLNLPGAWLAAAIFALHPVHVESVAWVAERKNNLSAVFYLAALFCYLRFYREKQEKYYTASLFLYIIALLSKTVTASLPVALAIITWWQKGKLEKNDLWRLLPFFIIGIPIGLSTAWLEKHKVGAMGMNWSYNFFERTIIASRAWWFYPGKIIFPHPLAFFYPRWIINAYSWQWLWFISAAICAGGLWVARNKIGRTPFAALAFYTFTISPALGYIDIYPMRFSFVADHFQYLASLGLIVPLSAAITKILENKSKRIYFCASSLLLTILAILTWNHCHIYKNKETLWLDTLAKNPQSASAHVNLGLVYNEQGKLSKAVEHYHIAIKLDPHEHLVYYNLANIHNQKKNYISAIHYYSKAISLYPKFWMAHSNLGTIQYKLKNYQESIASFQKALEFNPYNYILWRNLAGAHYKTKNYQKSLEAYQKALLFAPNDKLSQKGVILTKKALQK